MMQKKYFSIGCVLLLLGVGACNAVNKVTNNLSKKVPATAAVPQKKNILAGKWKLNYVTGPRITFAGLYPNQKPFIVLDSTKLQVNGNTGCNSFSGTFSVLGDSIHFGNLATTMMNCSDGGQGETIFLGMLGKVSHYRVSGDTLWFKFKKIDAMRFVRDSAVAR